MKIIYDHQIFSMQKYGGISRYFYELIKGIKQYSENEAVVSLAYTKNAYLSSNKSLGTYKEIKYKHFKGKTTLIRYINKYRFKKDIKLKCDIVHPTYYDPYFLNEIGDTPFVLTVYDMIHEKFAKEFQSWDTTAASKKLLVEKANKIIAISESTKKDLIEILNVDPQKIEVIYLANSLTNKSSSSRGNMELPERYILFVGQRALYKNFKRFVQAVAGILQEDPQLYIFCAGGNDFTEEEVKLFNKMNIMDRFIQKKVYDTELVRLYKKALVFVFPSCYEGFGIPLLEAMSCGCPVITSNVSSLPEVAGEAAYYFDPYDEGSIQASIKKVIYNESIRQDLIHKGYERNKQFSWEKTVQQTIQVYRSLI